MAPAFSSFQVKKMKNIAINKINEFMKRLDDISTREIGGKNFDPGKEMIEMTLQIIFDAAFEYQMDEKEQNDFLMNIVLALRRRTKRNLQSLFVTGRLGRLHPAGESTE